MPVPRRYADRAGDARPPGKNRSAAATQDQPERADDFGGQPSRGSDTAGSGYLTDGRTNGRCALEVWTVGHVFRA